MSPPKVSLAGKDVPKPVDDEATLAEGNSDPVMVTVEGARVPDHVERQRRGRRLVLGMSVLIIIALAALGSMAMVHRMRRHHRKHWSVCHGPKRLSENVEVDHRNKLIRVSHDHDQDEDTPTYEILHEYSRGMVAYKDTTKKICYVDRLDETFENGYERWEAYERHDRMDQKTLKVISEPIEVTVVKHIMDIHITEHCMDSQSVWVMEIDEEEVTTEMTVIHV